MVRAATKCPAAGNYCPRAGNEPTRHHAGNQVNPFLFKPVLVRGPREGCQTHFPTSGWRQSAIHSGWRILPAGVERIWDDSRSWGALMAQIIMKDIPGAKENLDGSVRGKAYAFMDKLRRDYTAPGLHIEPIAGSVDPQVRTGRVDNFWRAVLFMIPNKNQEPWFVYAGTFPHDEAIDLAKRVTLGANPVFGMAEVSLQPAADTTSPKRKDWQDQPWAQPENWVKEVEEELEKSKPTPKRSGPEYPVLGSRGLGVQDLVNLGIARDFAEKAMAARSDDEIVDVCNDSAPAAWQTEALLELATGTPLGDVRNMIRSWGEEAEELIDVNEVEEIPETPEEEEQQKLRRALRHPAARMDFNFIETDEDLRAALEDNDFEKWRVFLHPDQRRYVMASRNGAFRLSGGAGTGKTVVLLHRAKRLADQDPDSRIVLTTFNRTLSKSLDEGLKTLDPDLPRADGLGDPGVLVAGVDQLALQVLSPTFNAFARGTGAESRALEQVLGVAQADIRGVTREQQAWSQALEQVPDLPDHLRSESFMRAEYSLVILPRKVTGFRGYARVARRGRKIPLNRRNRKLVWDVVEQYRASCRVEGTTDFAERAMLAATLLQERVRDGVERPADHVLVDEAQDLNPSQLHFLRALVREGKNDLFLAEDAHQRIYAHPVTLSHHNIQIRGRSRRLRLNYRTTAQNLVYALNLLTGGNVDNSDLEFADLEGGQTGFKDLRSARNGPQPSVLECKTLTEQYDRAAETISSWLAEGVKGSSIGVLCHSNRSAGNVVGALIERGVPATQVQRRSVSATPSSSQTRNVQVLTMHRAKGMEFERVILFDLHEEPRATASSAPKTQSDLTAEEQTERERAAQIERDEQELQHRALIYVAASRARDEVVVLTRD